MEHGTEGRQLMDESALRSCKPTATHKVNKAETTEAEQHHTRAPSLHGNRMTQKDQIPGGRVSTGEMVEFLLKQHPEPIAGLGCQS